MNPESAGAAPASWTPGVNPWFIAGAVMLATFMEVLDTTIVSVALPNIAGSLAATNEEATWVLTSYLVANAIVLPASDWLARRFGRARFLLACVLMFTAASMMCAMAPNMAVLVLARVLQGLGGGAMQPLAQAILLESFPPAQRGLAMAMFGLGVVVAPVIGPTLGGWLTDNYSWRWVFNINLPVGLLAFYLIRRTVEDPPYIREGRPGRLDGLGFGLLALWLATLQIVLDKGQQEDWFASSWITWFSVVSMASLAALVVRELRFPEPIVDLRVFLNRNFWSGTVMLALICAAMYSALTVLPLFLQTLMGYTSQLSGIATSPRGLGALVSMPVAGALMNRMDGRHMMVLGVGLFIASNVMLARMNLEIAMSHVVWPNIVLGFGMGLALVPLMTLAVGTLPIPKIGNASGLFNLVRNVAGSVGISLSTTYIARTAQAYQCSMVAHLTPYDPLFQQKLAAFSGGAQPTQAAYGLAYAFVLQQANLRAFMDTFMMTAMLLAFCIPLAFILRRVKAQGTAMMH